MICLFLLIISHMRFYPESYQYEFFLGLRCGYPLSIYTKFELDRYTNKGDLLLDRKNWKGKHTKTHITQTETDFSPYTI